MTRNEIIEALDWSPRFVERDKNSLLARVERVVAQAVANERKACAALCEDLRRREGLPESADWTDATLDCADAILKRGLA